jgi:hypothetical protein
MVTFIDGMFPSLCSSVYTNGKFLSMYTEETTVGKRVWKQMKCYYYRWYYWHNKLISNICQWMCW